VACAGSDPAWVTGSRFAGGNGAAGPLTDRGRELMIALRELNVVLDVSHLSDDAFDEATDLQPLVVASHSNARALIGTPRHLPDEGLARLRDLTAWWGSTSTTCSCRAAGRAETPARR
jgi:membrane dipeptidase